MADRSAACAIATWFVADAAADATFFPQIGCRSDAPGAQAVYWRCTVAFFASSLAVNPQARHIFFTNTDLPWVDGVDVHDTLARWGVEVVRLPITWRLPPRAVDSWGNQFYVFDILGYWASHGGTTPLIVLDSDCLWLRSADEMVAALARHGALTYRLDADEHPEDAPINGLSRAGMARFLARHSALSLPSTPYFGGEILAATPTLCARIFERAHALWPAILAGEEHAPREEAHLLSVIYAMEGVAPGTANSFIRRMWTTFHHHNVSRRDLALTIWHLPAEKRTGFADLFARIAASSLDPRRDGPAMGLSIPQYARIMGIPRRHPAKFVRDLGLKLREKLLGTP